MEHDILIAGSMALATVLIALGLLWRLARAVRDGAGACYAGRNGAGVASNAGMVKRAIVPNCGAGLHA